MVVLSNLALLRLVGHVRRGVINPRVVIRLAAGEHEIHGTNEFMGQGHNGFFVSAPDHESVILGFEDRQGTSGRISGFTEQRAQKGVALAGLAAFSFAGTLVIAWTQCHGSPFLLLLFFAFGCAKTGLRRPSNGDLRDDAGKAAWILACRAAI
jgi:hypothetical protein